ncbi:MAG: hypothetical protein ABC585_01805 [Candidatus Methanosuratincola petrocarbonis]|nr:hypothetical protein [Candidatus Methanosuratincola sp.]
MQIGFEPKIVFLCPLCHKDVEMIYSRTEGWIADHGGCLNFSVMRKPPTIGENEFRTPLVFIDLESDFAIREAVEGLRSLVSEEEDLSKRSKIEAGIKRLESKIGFAEKRIPELLDVIKGGTFGLRIVSGRSAGALVWRGVEKFVGISYGNVQNEEEGLMLTSQEEETKGFILKWIHYWDGPKLVGKKAFPQPDL